MRVFRWDLLYIILSVLLLLSLRSQCSLQRLALEDRQHIHEVKPRLRHRTKDLHKHVQITFKYKTKDKKKVRYV